MAYSRISPRSPFAHLALVETLDDEHAEVERCEVALWAARERLKAAATRQGKTTDKLLARAQFVPRSVAEKWVDNAQERGRREGRDAEHEQFMTAIDACAPGTIAAAKAYRYRPPELTAEQKAYVAKLEKVAAMMSDPALSGYDLDTRARLAIAAIFGDDRTVPGVNATSEGIIRAGRMRRAEIETPAAAPEQNDVTVTPSMILSAAKKARGERTN